MVTASPPPRGRRSSRLLPTSLLLLALSACDSATNPEGAGKAAPEKPQIVTLIAANPEVATFGRAQLTVRGAALTDSSYRGTLGTDSITAKRSSDSTIAFFVPELSAGEHKAKFQIGKAIGETTLRVSRTPDIADPAAYVAALDSATATMVQSFEAWYSTRGRLLPHIDGQAIQRDAGAMRAAAEKRRRRFDALSPSDQRKVAMMIRASEGPSGTNRAAAAPSVGVDPDIYVCENSLSQGGMGPDPLRGAAVPNDADDGP